MKANIFDIKRFAVHDGPGIRTTFFLKGCPLRCLWCQNPESMRPEQEIAFTPLKCIGCKECQKVCGKQTVSCGLSRKDCILCGKCVNACETGARHFSAKVMTPDQVVSKALEDQLFYNLSGGGVTFSGGECLTHPAFMTETLRLCKEAGLHTTVDTCGFVPFETFKQVLPYTDLFLYDVKLIDPVRHKQYTGQSNELILNNLMNLVQRNANIIIRVPLIPGYTDNPEDISATGDFIINKLDNKIQRIELLQYNRLAASKYGNFTVYSDGGTGEYPLPDLEPQSREYIDSLRRILEEKGISVFCESL